MNYKINHLIVINFIHLSIKMFNTKKKLTIKVVVFCAYYCR